MLCLCFASTVYGTFAMSLPKVSKEKTSKSKRNLPPEALFADGAKEIDFIVIENFDDGPTEVEREKKALFSNRFEDAVRKEGLLVEKQAVSQRTVVKIHAPLERLLLQAEMEGIELSVLPCDLPVPDQYWFWKLFPRMRDPFQLPERLRIAIDGYFTKPYVDSARQEFILSQHPFTAAQRKFLVQRILLDVFIPCDELKGGYNYQNLLDRKIFQEAYIPHDCDLVENMKPDTKQSPESWPQRLYLAHTWASWKKVMKYQPLDEIRSYFGEQVAFYFAWLGFYTKLLFLPSAMGVVVLIISSILARDDAVTFCSGEDRLLPFCRSCASTVGLSISWCRGFVHVCIYQQNFRAPTFTSSLFSLFMTVWAGVMLDKWEKEQNTLAQRWSVKAIETYAVEKIRPEYRISVDSERVNLVTLQAEPHLSTRSAVIRFLSSISTVLFFICVVLALILATIVYKQNAHILMETTQLFSYTDRFGMVQFKVPPTMFTTITSSCMTLIIMTVMGRVYTKLAHWLTRLELPRTQRDFDNSFTYKLVVFQFVNYYGTVAYLAFIRPFLKHDPLSEPNTDVCPPQGCMYDLVFQLLIIMIFKQPLFNAIEHLLPRLRQWISKLSSRRTHPEQDEDDKVTSDVKLSKPDDPQLLPFGYKIYFHKDVLTMLPFEIFPSSFYRDHMELLIQFGYVVMFAGVTPLLPLFALINNILEIRIDAVKYVKQTKRLLPTRVRNIEPWLVLLRTLSRAAIFTNAFVFAFTTSFPGALLAYLHPSMLQTNMSHIRYVRQNGTIYQFEYNFPMNDRVTSYTAQFDWTFRFRPFPTLKMCYVYNENNHTVNDQMLAKKLPPAIKPLEKSLDIPFLNLTDINSRYRPKFDELGGYFDESLFMLQCRGGILFEGGYEIDEAIVDQLRKREELLRADEDLDELTLMAENSFRERVHTDCWANYDVSLVNNTLITSQDYYHVRYIQYTCAVAFILVASILQSVSQYVVPEHSEKDRVHEQRKHYVFRQHKRAAAFKNENADRTNPKMKKRNATNLRRVQSCEAIDDSQREQLVD